MELDQKVTTSRRAVLAASLGAVAGAVAHALGRPDAATAANGGNVVLGQENHATTETGVINDDPSETAFYGHVSSSGTGLLGESAGSGIGVKGTSSTGVGVHGFSTSNIGMLAQGGAYGILATGSTGIDGGSTSGPGVYGHTGSDKGVWGQAGSGTGVHGESLTGTGVIGASGSTSVLPGTVGISSGGYTGVAGVSGSTVVGVTPAKTGVYGVATQDTNARGVWGKSTSGRGVFGEATSGYGVRGQAAGGVGVHGSATTGYALRTAGRIRFDKSGGIATIGSGTNNVVVNPGIDLTATTAVLATLQGSAGGSTTVHRVVIDTTANTFRIYLTANAASNVKVAWLVFG